MLPREWVAHCGQQPLPRPGTAQDQSLQVPHPQPFSLRDLGWGAQTGISAFNPKRKKTQQEAGPPRPHSPNPSGYKSPRLASPHPPGPAQNPGQLQTRPDPRSVPAPATGVPPTGHSAHGKASWMPVPGQGLGDSREGGKSWAARARVLGATGVRGSLPPLTVTGLIFFFCSFQSWFL